MSLSNIDYVVDSLSGVITISDGISILENGVLTTNAVNTGTLTADSHTSTDIICDTITANTLNIADVVIAQIDTTELDVSDSVAVTNNGSFGSNVATNQIVSDRVTADRVFANTAVVRELDFIGNMEPLTLSVVPIGYMGVKVKGNLRYIQLFG